MMTSTSNHLIEGDGSLDSSLVARRLKALLLLLLNLVHLAHNAIQFYLASVKIVNSSRELVGLRITAEDRDFIADWKGISKALKRSDSKTYRSWLAATRPEPHPGTRGTSPTYHHDEHS